MSTLVIAEHDNKELNSSTYNTITAALQFKKELSLLIAGHHCQSVAEQAAVIAGVNTVFLVDNAAFAHPLAENMSDLIVELAKDKKIIAAPATTFGKNILPRVAAILDVTQVSDVTEIVNENIFKHPIYAGNAIETVKVLDETIVLTIRTTAFDPAMERQAACPIEKISTTQESKTKFIKQALNKSSRPELTHAKIIVSGGRGLQSAEQFKLVEKLADALGAAIGASRAAVDAGFVSNDYQVGQTGKVVAPDLYIALGISGAVQHLAGMKDSKIIVAINKDEDAPIFQIANYGLVGDVFELVPQLIELIKTKIT
jgi:electron transfer flavoprotein alpha subunit